MEFNPKYTISTRLANQLLEIERHKEAINVLPITPNLLVSLKETARLLSTHYSTQIEGNDLTQKEVQSIARGKQGNFTGRERDEREVRNYFRALAFVEEQLQDKAPITEIFIKTLHSLVLVGSKKPTPYREGQNVIKDSSSGGIVYMPPEAKDVSTLMKELVIWINQEVDTGELPAPLLAGLVHYQFATIHPYYDGNGRTARLLTTYILHTTGYGMKGIYSLEEYYAKQLSDYYDALNIGTSHNYYGGRAQADITPFLEYFVGGMSISFGKVRKSAISLQTKHPQNIDASAKLRELRPQQRAVLLLFQNYKEVGMQEIAEHLGMDTRSAYTLVKKWIEQGFMQIINTSKRTRTYGLSLEWESLLSQQQFSSSLKTIEERGKKK
ncbi:MAG: cell filamentation protein Fic [Bacteroidetes bacterium]|nr:MAG: cell filamentation protein Fic [Bacteroidota bacterium]